MRYLIAVVALLLLVSAATVLAADPPPGGPTWYQAIDGFNVSTAKGFLIIAPDTPGQLIGVTGGLLTIRFERGIALWGPGEITSDPLLTISVAPFTVRAFVKQPLSQKKDDSTTPRKGGAQSGALGALAGVSGAGSGTRGVGVQRETTLVIDDTVNVIRRGGTEAAVIPDSGRSGVQVFPPSGSGSGGGGAGRPGRVIAREEHDAWLVKVLRLLDEDGAACETKGYGPGWISICEPRSAA